MCLSKNLILTTSLRASWGYKQYIHHRSVQLQVAESWPHQALSPMPIGSVLLYMKVEL